MASVPKSVPIIGPKIKLGEQWKKNLHSIAASTVRLTQESQQQGTESVMSKVYTAQGAAADGDEQSKMIAVTMNAGLCHFDRRAPSRLSTDVCHLYHSSRWHARGTFYSLSPHGRR